MSNSQTKRLKTLRRLATQQGWEVGRSANGHLTWVPPRDGPTITSSSTPSTYGGIRNLENDLKRAGLRLDGSRPTNADAEFETAVEIEKLRATLMEKLQARGSQRPEDFALLLSASPELLMCIASTVDTSKDNKPLTMTCRCGIQKMYLSGFVNHLASCDEAQVSITENLEEMSVDRNMKSPPLRERLSCPECSEWFWVSQPHLLQQHMDREHGKQPCVYCEKWFAVSRGGIVKHMRVCSMRPPEAEPAPVETGYEQRGGARRPDPIVVSTRRPERGGTLSNPPVPAATPVERPAEPVAASVMTAPAPAVANPEPEPHLGAGELDMTHTDHSTRRITYRRPGERVTSKTYHLYEKCPSLPAASEGYKMSDGSWVVATEHVDLDDMMIELLGLNLCRYCERKSKDVPAAQVIAEALATAPEGLSHEELAKTIVTDLIEYGYPMKKR
jgi:hypothetical protein